MRSPARPPSCASTPRPRSTPRARAIPPADGRSLLFTRQVPRGVVGLITPWNFPLAIPLWKLAPALAYGNVCVMKPSEHSPVCADRIAGLFDGLLPEGVLQVLHGDGELGSALVGNELVRALSFTGSERTGRTVAERLAGRGAAAQCEMGGQNASIVLADADPAAAAAIIAGAAMGYAGQKCTATSRVICEEAAYPAVREALEAAVARMVVEDPEDEACQVGPLITEAAREKAMAAVGRAVDGGGRLVTGGEAQGEHGWYMQPTLVELDDPGAELAQEEVFGPVCALLRAADADDAVRIANGVRFGLVHGDLHPRPRPHARPHPAAGHRPGARQPADGRRRLPHAVRRREGLGLRPARAGQGRARVLHADAHGARLAQLIE